MKKIVTTLLIIFTCSFSFSQANKEFKQSEISFKVCDAESDKKKCVNDLIANSLTNSIKLEIKDYLDKNKKRTYVVNNASFVIGENGKAIKRSIKTTNKKGSEVGSKLENAILNLPEFKVRRNEFNYPLLSYYTIRIKNGINENDKVVVLDLKNKTTSNSKKAVGTFPIYPGCKSSDNEALRKCLSNNVAKVVSRKFKTKKALKKFNKKGSFYIYVFFTIDKDGKLINVKAFGPNKDFEEQALSAINKIKKITPGTKNGKLVKVPFFLPIRFKTQ